MSNFKIGRRHSPLMNRVRVSYHTRFRWMQYLKTPSGLLGKAHLIHSRHYLKNVQSFLVVNSVQKCKLRPLKVKFIPLRKFVPIPNFVGRFGR